MKKQFSLLAIGLCSLGFVQAQSTTNTYPATSSTTNSTYTSPTTTDGSQAAVITDTVSNGRYSTNNVAVPTNGTTTDVYNTNNSPARPKKDYKNFAYGIYVGLNTTRFKGESVDVSGNSALTGRLGYQAGFFVRGGGRLFGQIGAEYFASSSNYFVAGSGQSTASIRDQINIKYIQVPVYIGYKLTQSDRGISSVRVQIGLEYANQIGSTANQFGSLNNFQVKTGSFNGLGQIGFDAGPVFLDLIYHYGFSSAIQENTGFAGSQRRILSANFGFKF